MILERGELGERRVRICGTVALARRAGGKRPKRRAAVTALALELVAPLMRALETLARRPLAAILARPARVRALPRLALRAAIVVAAVAARTAVTLTTSIVRSGLAVLRRRTLRRLTATIGAAMTMVVTRAALIRATARTPNLDQRRFGRRRVGRRLIGGGLGDSRFRCARFRRGIRSRGSINALLGRRRINGGFCVRRFCRLVRGRDEIDARQLCRARCLLGSGNPAFVSSGRVSRGAATASARPGCCP